MQTAIHQINSFRNIASLPKGCCFTFPANAIRYYGLNYFVAGLNNNNLLYKKFYCNIDKEFAILFEITHTHIRQVIVDRTIPENLKHLLEEYKISYIYNDEAQIIENHDI